MVNRNTVQCCTPVYCLTDICLSPPPALVSFCSVALLLLPLSPRPFSLAVISAQQWHVIPLLSHSARFLSNWEIKGTPSQRFNLSQMWAVRRHSCKLSTPLLPCPKPVTQLQFLGLLPLLSWGPTQEAKGQTCAGLCSFRCACKCMHRKSTCSELPPSIPRLLLATSCVPGSPAAHLNGAAWLNVLICLGLSLVLLLEICSSHTQAVP